MTTTKIAGLPKGAVAGHVIPRAYCAAKGAPLSATFAVPPGGEYSGVVVHGSTVAECHVGDWRTLVYAATTGMNTWHAVPMIRIPGLEVRAYREVLSIKPNTRAMARAFEGRK